MVVAGASYYRFVYAPAHSVRIEVAYVLPMAVEVVDTPAAVRLDVEEVKNGDQVQVLKRTHSWARILMADGKTGWIEQKDLLDSQSFEQGQRLLRDTEKMSPQAVGHASNEINLHLDPSRESQQLTLIKPNEKVEIFERRMAERAVNDSEPPSPGRTTGAPEPGAVVRDAWYLVRSGSHAGWVLGRFIALDVPADIAPYAQGINTVAWLVLSRVDDNGRKVPQYLVADRIGIQEYDFNHIRVFTWWIKNQHYVTAYVGSDLNGFFPIRILQAGDKPEFRLRLVDKNGQKFQKVYAMSGTKVRPLGTVEGWESAAEPARSITRSRRPR